MFLLLLTVLVVIVTIAAILVRKNKYLVFLVIASGLAVVIADVSNTRGVNPVLMLIIGFAVFVYLIEHNTM